MDEDRIRACMAELTQKIWVLSQSTMPIPVPYDSITADSQQVLPLISADDIVAALVACAATNVGKKEEVREVIWQEVGAKKHPTALYLFSIKQAGDRPRYVAVCTNSVRLVIPDKAAVAS